jgi:very-short-patch-repair endonuclease
MQKDAAKEDYLRKLGVGLLRVPNGLVLEDPEEFVGKVREAIEARHGRIAVIRLKLGDALEEVNLPEK